MFGRQKIAAIVAEFLGSAILVSAVLSMLGRTSFPFFAAVMAGLTLALMILIMGPISGAHVNPIVTVGLWTVRKVQTAQAIVYIGAQMLGGVVALYLNEYLLNQSLQSIAGAEFDWRVFVTEAIGAMIFTIAVFAAISRSWDGPKMAFTAGTGLVLGMSVASLASNGLINPALAVGVQSWSVAYVLGPVAGAVVGMNLYAMLFAPLDKTGSRTAKAVVTKAVKKTKAATKKRSTRKKK